MKDTPPFGRLMLSEPLGFKIINWVNHRALNARRPRKKAWSVYHWISTDRTGASLSRGGRNRLQKDNVHSTSARGYAPGRPPLRRFSGRIPSGEQIVPYRR